MYDNFEILITPNESRIYIHVRWVVCKLGMCYSLMVRCVSFSTAEECTGCYVKASYKFMSNILTSVSKSILWVGSTIWQVYLAKLQQTILRLMSLFHIPIAGTTRCKLIMIYFGMCRMTFTTCILLVPNWTISGENCQRDANPCAAKASTAIMSIIDGPFSPERTNRNCRRQLALLIIQMHPIIESKIWKWMDE